MSWIHTTGTPACQPSLKRYKIMVNIFEVRQNVCSHPNWSSGNHLDGPCIVTNISLLGAIIVTTSSSVPLMLKFVDVSKNSQHLCARGVHGGFLPLCPKNNAGASHLVAEGSRNRWFLLHRCDQEALIFTCCPEHMPGNSRKALQCTLGGAAPSPGTDPPTIPPVLFVALESLKCRGYCLH